MLLIKCALTMACIGLAAQLVETSAVKRSLLKRPRRHLHSDHPVDIGTKVASPLRCSTTSFQNGMVQQVGFRDEITEVCNSSYCTPPRVASLQRPCPSICNNGGTMKENGVECICPEGFYGLFCETRSPCGQLLLEAEGSISMKIPFLGADLKCVWEIRTVAPTTGHPGHRIILAATDFSIPPFNITEESIVYDGTECPENNRINVYQDRYAPGYNLRPGGYCGNNSFQTVISEGNVLYVELLLSVSFNMSSEFTFLYKTIPNVSHYLCHSSWTLNSFHGILQTPGYPLNMPPRLRCEWTIIVQPEHTLKLDFKSIDIDERHPVTGMCSLDFIIVVSDTGEFATLCGSQINRTLQFENPGRVYLLLYTDAIRQGSGFQVYFKHIS